MYLPKRFESPSDLEIEEVVRAHPFATLITPRGVEAKISHVPLVLEKRGSEWVLIGHFARANDHWKFLEGVDATAIFHGPHSYVTPLWYEHCDVPTWNYVVAHLRGRPRLLEREEDTVGALKALSAQMEGEAGWKFEIPSDLAAPNALMKSIVGFEIPVSARAGKFKLSQNKSSTDIAGTMAGLATRKDDHSRAVLGWMRRLTKRE
ncbi:MAG: FMN-binding negative transcriptional regulator [Bdellovibrionota bacterium]